MLTEIAARETYVTCREAQLILEAPYLRVKSLAAAGKIRVRQYEGGWPKYHLGDIHALLDNGQGRRTA